MLAYIFSSPEFFNKNEYILYILDYRVSLSLSVWYSYILFGVYLGKTKPSRYRGIADIRYIRYIRVFGGVSEVKYRNTAIPRYSTTATNLRVSES